MFCQHVESLNGQLAFASGLLVGPKSRLSFFLFST